MWLIRVYRNALNSEFQIQEISAKTCVENASFSMATTYQFLSSCLNHFIILKSLRHIFLESFARVTQLFLNHQSSSHFIATLLSQKDLGKLCMYIYIYTYLTIFPYTTIFLRLGSILSWATYLFFIFLFFYFFIFITNNES